MLFGVAVERSGIAIAVRQTQHRLVVLIQQRDADRQAAGGDEIFQPDGLLDAQQRLQLITDIERGQHIQITDVGPLRAGADPIQVVVFVQILGVAVFQNALMQGLQHVFPIGARVAAAEFRHTQAVAADEEHPVKIVGRHEVLFPILDQAAQRIERTAVGGAQRAVGLRVQRKELRRAAFAGKYAAEHVQAADRTVEAILRHILDVADDVGGMADVALRLIEVEVVLLPDVRFFLMQDIQNIKGGEQRPQRPQQNRQHPEQIAGYFQRSSKRG